MLAQRELTYRSAFIVDETALKRLDGIVRDHSEGLTYRVKLSDGTILKPSEFNDVLGLTNTAAREIRSISIGTSYTAKPLHLEIAIDADMQVNTLRFDIMGEEKDVVFVSGKLEEWAHTITQWYSFLALQTFGFAFIQFCMFTLGLIIIFMGERLLWSPTMQVVSTIFGLVVMGISFTLPLLRRWIFPPRIFAVGDGQGPSCYISRPTEDFQTENSVSSGWHHNIGNRCKLVFPMEEMTVSGRSPWECGSSSSLRDMATEDLTPTLRRKANPQ